MKKFGWVLAAVLCAVSAAGQEPAAKPVASDLDAALAGSWVGVLEYRDYSEPATSTKRVALPTWLTVSVSGPTETWRYVYDDGPGKTVEETEARTYDASAGTVAVADNGKPAQVYAVTSYAKGNTAGGTLVLQAQGTDAGKPAELRVTLTMGRNLLRVLEEARPAASAEAFAFRHVYTFVRKDAPAVSHSR